MPKEIVTPPGFRPNPRGFSYVVKRSGTLVFIGGLVASGDDGQFVGEGDAYAQSVQVYKNLRTCIEAAGGTMNDIMKLTVYATDAAHWLATARAREKAFQGFDYPASTFVVVTSLAVPIVLVEVEAIAVIE
ncbi:MAG: RidA family protein [Dehalococcoidia bacterium]